MMMKCPVKALAISGMLLLIGCASDGGLFDSKQYDFIDRDMELSRDDYKNMGHENKVRDAEVASAQKSEPPVPSIAQMLAAPRPPQIGRTKLVSVSVTDDVPLKDVLIELARLADVDIELGPGINGGISFSAKDKPFNEVVERIANLANLRYKVKNGVLRVEQDVPYVKNYALDFLNITRNSDSSVNLSTDVLSSGEEGSGGGLTTGTTSTISGTTESDIWTAMESNLSQILNYIPADQLPEGEAANAAGASAEASGGGASGASSGGSGTGRSGAFYVINRQAGVLSVSATERQHHMVADYINIIRRTAAAQVLIEAKIVEVELDQQYQSGIDWTAVLGNSDFAISSPISATTGLQYAILGPGKDADGVGAANPTGDNNLGIGLDAVVQLTERFGTSRIISSPRLHAINNQQAVLTFAENRIFFEVTVEREDAVITDGQVTQQPTVTVDSERRSVPVGLIMSILPSIDLDNNEVTLNVRPTISRQVESVQDPGSVLLNSLTGEGFINEVPVIEVREIDSIMKVKSGGVMIIGGLMQDSSANSDEGVPFVSDIPWVGNAFKSTNKQNKKTELIIFIKATVLGTSGHTDAADRNVYETFTDDPRPLTF